MKTLMAVLVVAATASTASADRDHDRLHLLSEAAARSNAGDHAGAFGLYEQAYRAEPETSLLPIIAFEYRAAGLPLDAISYYCTYLTVEPRGTQAAFATAQVFAIRAQLGQITQRDVCVEPAPVRVDFATPRRAPHTPNARGMSKREMAGLAGAALGVASLGAGLYFGLEARSISSSISNHSPDQPWADNIVETAARGQRYERRRDLLVLVGGAALVTGGILYVTGRADRLSSERLVITPTVGPDGGGISFARGF